MSSRAHIVVVGGGIAGLAAAHRLLTLAPGGVRVTVIESERRLGGKIRTESFEGRELDVGAEALLARMPHGPGLCRELGLGELLVAPVSDSAYVWTDRLRALPPRLMSGAPGGSRALAGSGILSPAGLARAAFDLLAPSRAPAADESIGSLVRRRLGGQALDRLIDPLLGGIHAASCDELSVRATVPHFASALGEGHGLVRGLRAHAPAQGPEPSPAVFLTLRCGLGGLVGALSERLACAEIRTGETVAAIERRAGTATEVVLDSGERIDADHVVIAAPAFAASSMLAGACPRAAELLAQIRYASVATIALSYAHDALGDQPPGSGFVAERRRGRTLTACTWSSAKWGHLSGGTALLKCSAGHSRDASALALDDDELIRRVRNELALSMGLDAEPLDASVHRFEHALPLYTVGHRERIESVEAALADMPGISVCGAAYHGVGVGSCIGDGRAAAESALAAVRAAHGPVREAGGRPAATTST